MPCPNQITMGRLVACVSAVAAAALVAACGGSSPSRVSRTVTEVVTETSTSPTRPAGTATAQPSTASTTATSTTTGTAACTAADLTPSYLGSNGALGQIALSFALRNSGQASCHTYGFPGVEFLSSAGAALPTHSIRTTHDVLGSTPASEIVLAPGQKATFRMITSDTGRGGGNGGCATASALQIIAPDDTATMRVTLTNGVVECGTTSVSALQPGMGAIPGV